jgi:hypothetical protein
MEKNKKIIILYYHQLIEFLKNNSLKFFVLLFLLQLAILAHSLPHLNVLPHYYLLVAGVLAFCVYLFFYKFVTNKMILYVAIASLVLSYPFVVLGKTSISELLGFITFLCLVVAILQKIYIERKQLSEVKDTK